jgi:hypothetical protein
VIPFEELDRTNGGEVVYTWENPDPPYGIRMWAVDRMNKWCEETNRQKLHSLIDQDRAKWFVENRGIERHRVEWLIANPLALINPCLMMRTKRNAIQIDGDEWDLMLDGHHRYVTLALLKKPKFILWHLTEDEARQFEVSGCPQPVGPLNVNAFSGIHR